MAATLEEDMALLKSAIEDGAALARRYFHQGAQAWDKRPGQPVTEADLAVDALLAERLRKARPDYGWLSEETADDPSRLSATRVWIVDPIDGTRAFIKGKSQWTVCGALVEDGRPRAGVIVNPLTQEVFEASEGGGARRNGVPIRASERTNLDSALLIGTAKLYADPAWPEPWPATIRLDIPSSIAYRLCLIASGARDGTIRLYSCHDWDIAGADIIVREAGGIMTAQDGAALVYNQSQPIQRSFIAAGPGLYPEIFRRTSAMAIR